MRPTSRNSSAPRSPRSRSRKETKRPAPGRRRRSSCPAVERSDGLPELERKPGTEMPLTYVPLLRVQRDLYRIPRGRDRFRAYLRTMIDWDIEDMRLPLGAMNPMG